MFFLGMSAHLLIYLLVPAFVIVCFYFRGIAGSPEVNSILAETVVCQPARHTFSSSTYVCSMEEEKESSEKVHSVLNVPISLLPVCSSDFYAAPLLSQNTLRAPPRFVK